MIRDYYLDIDSLYQAPIIVDHPEVLLLDGASANMGWRSSLIMRHSMHHRFLPCRCTSSVPGIGDDDPNVIIDGKPFAKDEFTNLTAPVVGLMKRKLLHQQQHPLNLVKQHAINYFDTHFIGRTGNPVFSVYDNLNPVVTVEENFDSLLIPEDHVSRRVSDTYYVNRKYLLRSHATAHQAELIGMGLDNFLIFGDCYRRDEIDSSHYPVFHQLDGVYTVNEDQVRSATKSDINLFEKNDDSEEKQGVHTIEALKFLEDHLKSTLANLTHHFYGNAGAADRIGWAFGIGLERLAMRRYDIPDIRVFWSQDSGVTSQFEGLTPEMRISYHPVSCQPQCINDLSFFLNKDKVFPNNDFYEIVRNVGGDYVEQVRLIDEFFHPRKNCPSRTYRIIYRHMDRPLTKSETNLLHTRISNAVVHTFDVEIRQ